MYRRFVKRALDFMVGLGLLLVSLPVMLVVGVVLWVTCGKVFFVQERVGYRRRKFRVIKFCTMTDEKDHRGELLPDVDRCTRVGNFLRRWSIDELPQLINIIKGDMSLVGPRPFMERYVKDCVGRELRRFLVRPGITGLAQINGRNAVSYKNRFRYDVWYVEHCTFGVDMKILYYTARMVLGLERDRNSTKYDPTIEERYR